MTNYFDAEGNLAIMTRKSRYFYSQKYNTYVYAGFASLIFLAYFIAKVTI